METKDKQSQNLKIKTQVAPQIDEIYVDGVSGLMARGGVFKLDCYRVTGFDPKENTEVRQVAHRLVIPNTAINELMGLLKGVQETSKAIQESAFQDVSKEKLQ